MVSLLTLLILNYALRFREWVFNCGKFKLPFLYKYQIYNQIGDGIEHDDL